MFTQYFNMVDKYYRMWFEGIFIEMPQLEGTLLTFPKEPESPDLKQDALGTGFLCFIAELLVLMPADSD